MNHPHVILGVHVTDRLQNAMPVQALLTEYGAFIKTRLGLHEVGADGLCGTMNGLLLLEMVGGPEKARELADRLNAIGGIEARTMVFDHPGA
ncbi:hypothetical protein KBD49_09435 [Myxococcota bacterium]|mgnify:CR=1 FL=1|jgi:hypothetical protein|nr:hypothetical protein [Myxococcota bacterium]